MRHVISRLKQIVNVYLVLIISIVFMSCATAPPVRKIPPDQIRDFQVTQMERKIHKSSVESINKFLHENGDKIGEPLKEEAVAITESLRQALKWDNMVKIRAKAAQLNKVASLLIGSDVLIEQTSTILRTVGDKLSPSLRREVKSSIRALQQAMKGDSWDDIQKRQNALSNYSWPLQHVSECQRHLDDLDKLGDKLGPSLRNEILTAFKPLQQAMKANNWNDIVERSMQLPRSVNYPLAVIQARDEGRAVLEMLSPSEKPSMLSALKALDLSMRGDDWGDVMVKVDRVKEIGPMFGIDSKRATVLGRSSCVRILSIDGGGVRGIIPAMILAEIEKRTGRSIAELFDVIVGTSTGAILALGLTKPDPKDPSKPEYVATRLVDLYIEEGEKIFPQEPLTMIRQLWGSKYSPEGLEAVLREKFGNTYMIEALTNVVIPTYDLEKRWHIFFNTYDSREMVSYPYYMRDIARAASAAPTFFPPCRLPISNKKSEDFATLIDGGVFANDPSPQAISIVKRWEYFMMKKPHEPNNPLLLLSIGTGRVPSSATFEDAWRWGIFDWLKPLIDIVFSDPGVEGEAKFLMEYGDFYFRLQPAIPDVSAASLDNASKSNLQYLQEIAKDYINENDALIENIARSLLLERSEKCKSSSRYYEKWWSETGEWWVVGKEMIMTDKQ